MTSVPSLKLCVDDITGNDGLWLEAVKEMIRGKLQGMTGI